MTQVQPNKPNVAFQSDVWPEETGNLSFSWQAVFEFLRERGLGGMGRVPTILMNEAMALERSAELHDMPFYPSALECECDSPGLADSGGGEIIPPLKGVCHEQEAAFDHRCSGHAAG